MPGGKNRQSLGYTILEVMIVLAVSGVMFLIASTFISGKQEKTSFTAGVNEMASRVQDMLEQVSDGSYSDIPLQTCTYNGNKTSLGAIGPAQAQGTNSGCVFLGKLMRFPQDDTNLKSYQVLSMVGGRLSAADVAAAPNDPAAGDPIPVDPDLTVTEATPQGLQAGAFDPGTKNVYVNALNSSGVSIAGSGSTAFGFIQSQGQVGSGGSFQGGAQTIYLVYVKGLKPNQPNNHIGLPAGPGTLQVTLANQVQICLTDSVQTALITVGGDNNQLGVDIRHLSAGAVC